MAGKSYRHEDHSRTQTNQGVALQNDATITRYNDRLVASYELSDAKGTTLTSGSQTGLSSYNVASSPYSTLAAQQDADKRAAEDMAERIRLDLGAWFRAEAEMIAGVMEVKTGAGRPFHGVKPPKTADGAAGLSAPTPGLVQERAEEADEVRGRRPHRPVQCPRRLQRKRCSWPTMRACSTRPRRSPLMGGRRVVRVRGADQCDWPELFPNPSSTIMPAMRWWWWRRATSPKRAALRKAFRGGQDRRCHRLLSRLGARPAGPGARTRCGRRTFPSRARRAGRRRGAAGLRTAA